MYSLRKGALTSACFHSSSFPQSLTAPFPGSLLLHPFCSADSLRRAYITEILSRFIMVAIVLSFSLSLSHSFVASLHPLYIPFSLPSIYSLHLRSSLLFSSIICLAPPPPFCNDPRSLPLSLCPTSQPFRNDVICAIGVDLAVFSRGFNDKIRVVVQILVYYRFLILCFNSK